MVELFLEYISILGRGKVRKSLFVFAACAALVASIAGTAAAEELRGRVAVTARLGIINPAESEKNDPAGKLVVETDPGVIGGGGALVGIDDNLALAVEVTRAAFHTEGFGSAGVTDLSFGMQYRLPEKQRFIPYAGAGIDVLINDLSHRYTDTVVGFHLAAGVDYMLMRQVALNAEVKGVEAFSADVREEGRGKVGEFDPSNLGFTVGARFFFN